MKQVFFETQLHAGYVLPEPKSTAILKLAVSGQQKIAIRKDSGLHVFLSVGCGGKI